MRGIPDQDDTPAVPPGHVDLADGVEVELRVVPYGVQQSCHLSRLVTGKSVDEQLLLRLEVAVVVVQGLGPEWEDAERLSLYRAILTMRPGKFRNGLVRSGRASSGRSVRATENPR